MEKRSRPVPPPLRTIREDLGQIQPVERKYRIVENPSGYYIQTRLEGDKIKKFLWLFPYRKTLCEEWQTSIFHLQYSCGLVFLLKEGSAFKTLEEAKSKVSDLIKYEKPIIHDL